MENPNSENLELIKKSRYTEAQKRAVQKYRSKNRDKYNEMNKKYVMNYFNKHKNEEEYKLKNRLRAKKHYEKKKAEKLLQKNNIEINNLNNINSK